MKFALLLFLTCLVVHQSTAQPANWDEELTRQMKQVLLETSVIKVGVTRGELQRLFTTEGGVSTALERTYVYRRCPFIKVDVEFEPIGRPARNVDGRATMAESNEDLIASISRPYLAWSVAD